MDSVASSFVETPQPDTIEVISQFIAISAITTTSILFGIKTKGAHLKSLSYSQWLVTLLYSTSWSFTFAATLLMATNNGNYISCFLSEMSCDIFYAGTKIIIYLWMIERVHILTVTRKPRLKSLMYRFHLLLMTPYGLIFALMMVFHVAIITDTGVCYIGLRKGASIPVLVYDFVFNAYMTILFVLPLMKLGKRRTDWQSSRLNMVAQRALIASVVSLLVSFANILGVVITDGEERGVICLTCCTLDVLINLVTIHWVTTHRPKSPGRSQHNTSSLENHQNSSGENNQSRQRQPHQTSSRTERFSQQYPFYVQGNTAKDPQKDDDSSDTHSSSIIDSHCSRKTLTRVDPDIT